MSLPVRLRHLRRDEAGAAIVEFGLLAPVLIVMMMGVLQVGLAVQNFNAVRNVAADVSRHMLVEFGNGHPMSNTAMVTHVRTVAMDAPYLLKSSSLTATVIDVTTPQVSGTVEKTLTITYQIPSVLDGMGLHGPSITYSRPLIATSS